MPLGGHKNGSKPFLKSLTVTTGVPSCVMSSIRGCSTKTVWNGLDMSVSLIKFTHSDGFTTLNLSSIFRGGVLKDGLGLEDVLEDTF